MAIAHGMQTSIWHVDWCETQSIFEELGFLFLGAPASAATQDTLANILGLIVLGSAVSKISQALADMRANSESDDRQRREIRLPLVYLEGLAEGGYWL